MNFAQSASTMVLVRPRIGFALFSIGVAFAFFGIYALVAISNGEGEGAAYYLYRVLAPLPIVVSALLQTTCRITADDVAIYKHDLFTTRVIPINMIASFSGENGLVVNLKDGRFLEYWGHGNSLVADVFDLQGSYVKAHHANIWLEQHSKSPTHTSQMRRKLRTDLRQVLLASVILSIVVALVTWQVADKLRPIVNSPGAAEFFS